MYVYLTKIITSTLLSTPGTIQSVSWQWSHLMFTLSIFSGTIQWILSAYDIKFRNGILKREIWNLEKCSKCLYLIKVNTFTQNLDISSEKFPFRL